MSLLYLVPALGSLSFLSPCMWNLNLLLRAYTLKEGLHHPFLMLVSRVALLNLFALASYLVPLDISLRSLVIVQAVVASVFIFGFPLMRRLGLAPFDLSPQFLLRTTDLPPGIALGMSVPYCSVPFIALMFTYSLYLDRPFLIFNLYALFSTVPSLVVIFAPEGFLKRVSSLIPAVPAFTGFCLVLSLGLILDPGWVNLYVSSLLQEGAPFYLLVALMLLLGFLTSLGPSTLPLLPVVFGVLITRHRSNLHIALSLAGFFFSFLITHSVAGLLVSAGLVVITDLFRAEVFTPVLALILLLLGLSLLRLLPLSVEISRLNLIRDPFSSSLALGVAYTFSLCPSCTSLMLGAFALSVSAGDPLKAGFLMGVYAVGRSVPVFLSGVVVGSMREFVERSYAVLSRFAGVIFLLISAYLMKNFLEVVL
ncbi:MAG: cytochrome c biogenesis protein CcdA [Aquificota bacterium]|nr:cytochrome c biogenesis protein CcdA [Aquificota bacterium]MDQ7082029.1 cytochrome c biogenesis protein CcdA [Aquificota bacterium]